MSDACSSMPDPARAVRDAPATRHRQRADSLADSDEASGATRAWPVFLAPCDLQVVKAAASPSPTACSSV